MKAVLNHFHTTCHAMRLAGREHAQRASSHVSLASNRVHAARQPFSSGLFNSHCANMAEDRLAPRSPPAAVPPPGHGEVPMSEPAIRNLIREEVAAAVAAALAQPPTSSAPGERHSLR